MQGYAEHTIFQNVIVRDSYRDFRNFEKKRLWSFTKE